MTNAIGDIILDVPGRLAAWGAEVVVPALPKSKPSGSDAIWSMLSGYASRKRGEKPLAFLQAFVDDSASDRGDQRLFMAGYLNRAEKWALFSDAWDEELRASPSIEYLKMVEAYNLRDQFKGWTATARDEKLCGLARVIRHFRPLSFEVSVPRAIYYGDVKPVAPRGFGPHFMCVFGLISVLSRFVATHKSGMQIKFIFDQQTGVSADVHAFFDWMLSRVPKEARSLIGGVPAFENDRHILPLQAADMLAWSVRREHEEGVRGGLPMANLLRDADGHLVSEFDEKTLRAWSEGFSRIPGVPGTQTKAQWRAIRREFAQISSRHQTASRPGRLELVIGYVRSRLTRLFNRT